MHRVLVGTEVLEVDSPALADEARRHLKVLRPRPGEAVELFDGQGRTRAYAWSGNGLVAAGRICAFARPPVALTLFACVTKGSRWDWTVEKATELGVTRVVPVVSERTIVRLSPGDREPKRARWMRIAEDAARQSDAKWLPEVVAAVGFAEALELVRSTTCFTGALTDPPSEPLARAVRAHRAGPGGYAAFVGPEGDFTPAELAALLEVSVPTSFGPTVLRAETAAVYALSVIAAEINS